MAFWPRIFRNFRSELTRKKIFLANVIRLQLSRKCAGRIGIHLFFDSMKELGHYSLPRSRFLGCHATIHPKEAAADIRTAFLSLYWPIIGRVPFLGTLSRQTRIVQSETIFYHGPRVSSGESKTGVHI